MPERKRFFSIEVFPYTLKDPPSKLARTSSHEQCFVFDVADIYLEFDECRPAVKSNPVCFHFTPAIKFGKGQVIQAKQPLTQNDPGWI